MFKTVPTYSLFAALLTSAFHFSLFITGWIGAATEFTCGLLLLLRLISTNQFYADTIHGKILSQLTLFSNISLRWLTILIGMRIAGFIFFAYGFFWISIPLYLVTIIHYLPNEKAGQ